MAFNEEIAWQDPTYKWDKNPTADVSSNDPDRLNENHDWNSPIPGSIRNTRNEFKNANGDIEYSNQSSISDHPSPKSTSWFSMPTVFKRNQDPAANEAIAAKIEELKKTVFERVLRNVFGKYRTLTVPTGLTPENIQKTITDLPSSDDLRYPLEELKETFETEFKKEKSKMASWMPNAPRMLQSFANRDYSKDIEELLKELKDNQHGAETTDAEKKAQDAALYDLAKIPVNQTIENILAKASTETDSVSHANMMYTGLSVLAAAVTKLQSNDYVSTAKSWTRKAVMPVKGTLKELAKVGYNVGKEVAKGTAVGVGTAAGIGVGAVTGVGKFLGVDDATGKPLPSLGKAAATGAVVTANAVKFKPQDWGSRLSRWATRKKDQIGESIYGRKYKKAQGGSNYTRRGRNKRRTFRVRYQ